MSLIIDGYNLMHAAGIMGRGVGPGGLERSRLALLNFVVESLEPAELAATTVVFDSRAAPPGLPKALVHRGITVRFAAGFENADELIEQLISRDSAPRRLTVVSSDHRLHRAARRRKAQAIDSDRWYTQTVTRRSERRHSSRADAHKPTPPLAQSEVEFWLAKFADEPQDESTSSIETSAAQPSIENAADSQPHEIFPQEYLDSIDEKELGE
jgi:predicted RNA-binding protein with PIN domain